jgi:hypothetical protein
MSKLEFIEQMKQLDPKARAKFVQSSNVPDHVKREAHQDAKDHQRRTAASGANVPPVVGEEGEAEIHMIESPAAKREGRETGPEGLTLVDSNNEDVPFHSVRHTLASHDSDRKETAAQRRRRLATEEANASQQAAGDDEDDDDETPAERRRRLGALTGSSSPPPSRGRQPATSSQQQSQSADEGFEGETAAERKRRLGALGVGGEDSPSDSEGDETGDPLETGRGTHMRAAEQTEKLTPSRAPGIRFADQPRIPTKDERAAEEAKVKEEETTGKKSKLGGFPWGKK